jgi:hypothetical protein
MAGAQARGCEAVPAGASGLALGPVKALDHGAFRDRSGRGWGSGAAPVAGPEIGAYFLTGVNELDASLDLRGD